MTQTLLITPGEKDGVGLEVTLKALHDISSVKKNSDKVFIFFADKKNLDLHLKKLDPIGLEFKKSTSLNDTFSPGVYWLDSNASAFSWFEEAVHFCASNKNSSALITGPLRKSSFKDSGAVGHTDYLRMQFSEPCFMTFFGDTYNSLLLSDHLPIDKVSDLEFDKLLEQAFQILKKIPKAKKMALLGLNPHAGEGGLIGQIDEEVHKPFVQKYSDYLDGPLPADSFFSLETYSKYSFLIANYHDQALIPFKLIHGFNGAQASLGLPFVRTSVDHGTGDALYLKNKANPKSMIRALNLAVELLNSN